MTQPNQLTLDSFEIIRRLGESAVGSSYLARNKLTGQKVVLKIYEPRDERTYTILSQIILGVGYLHSLRICHRDLKPSNILLTGENNEVRIGNFEISNILDPQQDFLSTMVGTAQYVSPEMLRSRQFKFGSEIWGIGVTIYELLTHRPPFTGRSAQETLQKIRSDDVQPTPIPDIYSVPLRDTVNAMLIKDETLRIPLNQLVKIPGIKERVKSHAGQLLTTANDSAKIFLNHILNDEDILPPNQIQRAFEHATRQANDPIEPERVSFEILDPLIFRQQQGEQNTHLVQLVQLQDKGSQTVTVAPEVVSGDGTVRVQLKFEDQAPRDRGYRWVGVIDADHEMTDKYYPGQDGDSVGYCGRDGSVVHITQMQAEKYIDGNSVYQDGDTVVLEINMTSERETRKLTFFVNGRQQPISFIGLPDRVKICVQRRYQNQSVKIISFEKVPTPTIVADIPEARSIQW
ncbi:MAG: putative NEK protein kinase [Streblomastix strix]|uniref:non-specific serine/threonine protein kinase n=1 Tax=Streblomastix strix TaxID=222440 RepID=A0A5J4WPZ7_9EUKA|nr:MAG: putative NEK protein kinase [Streblomastix strix]